MCVGIQAAFKLFTEVDLIRTFRIPETEFLCYFHALELGYRDKPCMFAALYSFIKDNIA